MLYIDFILTMLGVLVGFYLGAVLIHEIVLPLLTGERLFPRFRQRKLKRLERQLTLANERKHEKQLEKQIKATLGSS